MDDEVFKKAIKEDLSMEEAEELQDLVDETGLDVDEAREVKELAEELGVDIDEATEINECL